MCMICQAENGICINLLMELCMRLWYANDVEQFSKSKFTQKGDIYELYHIFWTI